MDKEERCFGCDRVFEWCERKFCGVCMKKATKGSVLSYPGLNNKDLFLYVTGILKENKGVKKRVSNWLERRSIR